MGFGEGPLAVRAAKPEQPISVFSEALTIDVASFASHCLCGLCHVHHGFNIQRALAVSQEKTNMVSTPGKQLFASPADIEWWPSYFHDRVASISTVARKYLAKQ